MSTRRLDSGRHLSTRSESGYTLVELMIALLLAGIVCAFSFSMIAHTSTALQNQRRISELQQTLRAASELIARDMRMAGLLTANVQFMPAITVVNSSGNENDDTFTVTYSDLSPVAQVPKTGPAYNAAVTEITMLDGDFGLFHEGDVVLAVRRADPLGACLLALTGVQDAGPHKKLQHNPGESGRPWNLPGNKQCDHISGSWNDGNTLITKLVFRSYRIRPDDPRGVLETSANPVSDEWHVLATGIVDLQVALRVFQPNDTSIDEDLDGDLQREWFSSENMENLGGATILQARVTLVGRTGAEAGGLSLQQSPPLGPMDAGVINPAFNSYGDHASFALPVDKPGSRYDGPALYRTLSTLVDVRNLGVGN